MDMGQMLQQILGQRRELQDHLSVMGGGDVIGPEHHLAVTLDMGEQAIRIYLPDRAKADLAFGREYLVLCPDR